LMGDRLRLEQALGNLVENALRYGDGRVLLAAHPKGEGIELHVIDHGPGFPDAFLGHAFDRFSRADVSHTGSGAGLGLAIVEAIARAHGGRAQAANSRAGTDVSINVPSAAKDRAGHSTSA
jgi:signal transduction histidine kinase